MHPLFIIRNYFSCSIRCELVKLYLLEVEHLLREPINLLMKPEVTGPSSRMNEFQRTYLYLNPQPEMTRRVASYRKDNEGEDVGLSVKI